LFDISGIENDEVTMDKYLEKIKIFVPVFALVGSFSSLGLEVFDFNPSLPANCPGCRSDYFRLTSQSNYNSITKDTVQNALKQLKVFKTSSGQLQSGFIAKDLSITMRYLPDSKIYALALSAWTTGFEGPTDIGMASRRFFTLADKTAVLYFEYTGKNASPIYQMFKAQNRGLSENAFIATSSEKIEKKFISSDQLWSVFCKSSRQCVFSLNFTKVRDFGGDFLLNTHRDPKSLSEYIRTPYKP
jgi:hypothetical protein